MSQILEKLKNTDPNNSEAIKDALAPFFQQLPKHTEGDCLQWLRTLEHAISRFPKYCMSQRGNIETYLTSFLDSPNYYIVIAAAKCGHALQQVRPTQEKTATPKSCWRDQMNALCGAAHALLGELFPNAVDIYQQMGKVQKDPIVSTSPLMSALYQLNLFTAKEYNKALNKQTLLSIRLRNTFVFIQAMLVEIYPSAKPICPQTILDVIVRALSVTSGNNNAQNIENVVKVKTEALRTLDALVACLGSNLIPFSPLLFRLVMQTLKWCSDNPSEQSSKVRCTAYRSLRSWLSVLHSHRAAPDRGRSWQDEVADHLIADITPYRHTVELKISSQPTKHLSKKAKRKLANSMLQESSISSHMPGEKNKIALSEESNDEVAIAALEFAETFLIVCGIFLSPATHKRFQERLVRECHALSNYSASRSLALLRALEAARKSVPATIPPPTQYCLQVYSVHINSEHREITNFCSQALLDIRMHLHCAPPSLNFAVEASPRTSEKEEQKKQISERNRAALEALLGPNKVPNQANKEEIITISDEPLNKRSKLDESDKISVSSESEGSIEISDDSDSVDGVHAQEVEVVGETKTNTQGDVEPSIMNNAEKTIETSENDVHNQLTQIINVDMDISDDKVDSTQPDNVDFKGSCKLDSNTSIFEAQTQLPPNVALPLNISNDDDEETPLSLEVVYDYPNTGKEKVAVLEKLDGDNLPSTNETDDVHITCGQVVKNSQDLDSDSKKGDVKPNEIKVNGTEVVEPVQNGEVLVIANVASKEVNVEDMLADFVDEVNEDTQTQQT